MITVELAAEIVVAPNIQRPTESWLVTEKVSAENASLNSREPLRTTPLVQKPSGTVPQGCGEKNEGPMSFAELSDAFCADGLIVC